MQTITTDVAIIGAGPGGSTAGGFLRKYGEDVKVSIFERESFPRDHVGESQLPLVSAFLHELGVWNAVEAAGFPVKIGATYRWGKTDDLWDFHFLPNGDFRDEPRPAEYRGQRTHTAFQVDRAIYDKILADHAERLGCDIHYESHVREITRDGDLVTSLILADGSRVEAHTYIDASGHSGLLRRAMGIGVKEPSSLRNVAFWDYWQNAEWAVSVGVGGTRVQVMSVGYGWLWFIPLSPTRTSIGLVCPADYYKSSGLRPEELYRQAIQDDPLIRSLVETATPEGKFSTTKDWSFVADRMTGENWFLVGEALGFADPILAAGLTLTHASARECAFTILEANKLSPTSSSERTWLRDQYEQGNRRRVMQHIRFADYWYLANATFTDLKDYTREIARDAGLELDAERAFQWLGTGGFIEEDRGVGGIAAFGMAALLQISAHFSDGPFTCALDGYNMYHLTLKDAKPVKMARYSGGRVEALPALQRDGKFLPLHGVFGHIVAGLRQSPEASHLEKYLCREFGKFGVSYEAAQGTVFNCLEAMARDGWICCERSDNLPALEYPIPAETPAMGPNRDVRRSSARPPRN